jgi:hypothetical protein
VDDSDRSVKEYADEIWNIKPYSVEDEGHL